jgi:hypothetical protein
LLSKIKKLFVQIFKETLLFFRYTALQKNSDELILEIDFMRKNRQAAARKKKAHSNNPHTRKKDEDCTLDGLRSTYPMLIDNVPFELSIGEIRYPDSGLPEGNNYGKILYKHLLTTKDAVLNDPKCNATVGGKITSPLTVRCFQAYDDQNTDDHEAGSTAGYPLAQLTRQNTTRPPNGGCIYTHFFLNPALSPDNINQEMLGRGFLAVGAIVVAILAAFTLLLLCGLGLFGVSLLGIRLFNKVKMNTPRNANEDRLLTENPVTFYHSEKKKSLPTNKGADVESPSSKNIKLAAVNKIENSGSTKRREGKKRASKNKNVTFKFDPLDQTEDVAKLNPLNKTEGEIPLHQF